MKFKILTEKGETFFEADEIYANEHYISGKKDQKMIAYISRDNVFAVIPQE